MTYPGCQLATEFKAWPFAEGVEAALEPKMDGYRLTAIVAGPSVSFHCRNVKPPDWAANLGHIADELLAMGFADCLIDGEVMAASFNKTGMVRSKPTTDAERNAIEEHVKFHAFDHCRLEDIASARVGRGTKMVDPTPFVDRRARLAGHFAGVTPFAVKLAPMFLVDSEPAMRAVLARLLAEGHEGGMLKDLAAPYVCDRTRHWLKLKPTVTSEMRVVRAVEGTGKYAGMLGALECVDAEGREVSVGTGFIDAHRADLWARREALPGLIVEVKQQAQTGSFAATARHPVFVRERPDRTGLAQ